MILQEEIKKEEENKSREHHLSSSISSLIPLKVTYHSKNSFQNDFSKTKSC